MIQVCRTVHVSALEEQERIEPMKKGRSFILKTIILNSLFLQLFITELTFRMSVIFQKGVLPQ